MSRDWQTEWYLFVLSLLFEFSHVCVSQTHSAESCVGNKPHNQFIITLCIGWMRMVRAKHGEKWSKKRKFKHKEHSTSKHTHSMHEVFHKRTAATCYTSVIERLPQKPFFSNSISSSYRFLLLCFFFLFIFVRVDLSWVKLSFYFIELFSFLILSYTFYDCHVELRFTRSVSLTVADFTCFPHICYTVLCR